MDLILNALFHGVGFFFLRILGTVVLLLILAAFLYWLEKKF